ncbi:MAG: methyltransferase domain-containing protein [Nitrospira sp.]|nr:methyltransferase domain-containing protein [Nitrospira sp.]MCP9465272.1 methyltransferase domain-containing protein [Nitrospira sp.]
MVSASDRGDAVKPPITTFTEFREAVSAYRLPFVLLAALELDLCTVIGNRAWTIPELAKTLKVSERGLGILCRNLAMAGVLKKQGALYRNSKVGATALNAHHPTYRREYLALVRDHWSEWLRLPEAVKTGRPIKSETSDDPDWRRRFTWAMHYRTLELAPAIASQVKVGRARTLLDLGGGPGTYALAFLARHPRLQATVCDREAALEVARAIAATHPAGRRLSYLPLDFTRETIPGHYDVIWYSNVLHMYSPADNQAIFRRILAALEPGGRLIIQDAFLHDREGLYPAEASLFAVSMLLFTEAGDTYPAAEVTRWLKTCGFVRVRLLRLKQGTKDWEGGILEAVAPGPSSRKTAPRRESKENSTSR